MESITTFEKLYEYLQENNNTLVQVDVEEYTPLLYALDNEDPNMVMKMLDLGASTCRLDHVHPFEGTALAMACKRQMWYVAMRMLEFGSQACNLHSPDDDGDTAFAVTCALGEKDVAMRMLEFGVKACNVHHENVNGETALDYALMNGMDYIVTKLEAQT
ncbi:hypothetical protein CL622_01965 [archaeon]|nr:hypothetical protein [archaeon]|tara:strand:+ start:120 stop:599 length:480 start_codon:yes stop_codon:yes gene_type:complete